LDFEGEEEEKQGNDQK